MANFNINQVTFEMRILHWIVFKIMFCKPPSGQGVLLKSTQYIWVNFTLNRIEYCRSSLKRSLFFSYFIQFILKLNGIFSTEEDFLEEPNPIDSIVIKLTCYFKDDKHVYYYLDNVGIYVYEDIIKIPSGLNITKKKKKEVCSSS